MGLGASGRRRRPGARPLSRVQAPQPPRPKAWHGWGVSNTLITDFGTGVEARDDIRISSVDVWALKGVLRVLERGGCKETDSRVGVTDNCTPRVRPLCDRALIFVLR